MPGVELREPRNLCACVSEECGRGEGAGAHATVSIIRNNILFILNRESESLILLFSFFWGGGFMSKKEPKYTISSFFSF
jgi:hypothetical protein